MSLDQLRTARELTQENLAELLGVKQASISKLERRPTCTSGRSPVLSRRWVGDWKFGRAFPMVQ
ncbi:MAG: helix-turn-helix transcriptional regulator [Ignavibacteriota bacterium]